MHHITGIVLGLLETSLLGSTSWRDGGTHKIWANNCDWANVALAIYTETDHILIVALPLDRICSLEYYGRSAE